MSILWKCRWENVKHQIHTNNKKSLIILRHIDGSHCNVTSKSVSLDLEMINKTNGSAKSVMSFTDDLLEPNHFGVFS